VKRVLSRAAVDGPKGDYRAFWAKPQESEKHQLCVKPPERHFLQFLSTFCRFCSIRRPGKPQPLDQWNGWCAECRPTVKRVVIS